MPRCSTSGEDMYLEAARGDDFIGVQSYTSQTVDVNGIVPHPDHPDNTLMGWAYRPDALGIAIRHTRDVVGDVPIVVTEHGIATDDDERRIAYTTAVLDDLFDAVATGIDVPRVSALEPARQLRVGTVGAHVRTDRRRSHDLRTATEAEPGVARRHRPGERTPSLTHLIHHRETASHGHRHEFPRRADDARREVQNAGRPGTNG